LRWKRKGSGMVLEEKRREERERERERESFDTHSPNL
jgi:hypothetical protein